MSTKPIRLAVIGHTNTGKTSVLRSLLRDGSLGDVADAPGTTRRSERHLLRLGGTEAAVFWDTPGLEDAARALGYLRRLEAERSLAGAAALDALLDQPAREIEHDLLPLRTLKECDAGLLVFDSREPPRNKYWEEHELLRRCGRPIVAVLNCTADERARVDEWDAALRKNGLHAVVRYDAWAASEADAGRLFVKLRELMDPAWADAIDRIVRWRAAEHEARVHAMAEELAALVVNLASHRVVAGRDDRTGAHARLMRTVAEGWSELRGALAELHGIPRDRLAAIEAELGGDEAREAGAMDSTEARITLGSAATAVAGGLLAGGVKGGVIDAGTGGATLGLGMVVGGAAGVALGGRELVRQASLRARGETEFLLSDALLGAIFVRGVWLIGRLQRFGQASERVIAPEAGVVGVEGSEALKGVVRRCRAHRGWSRIGASAASEPSEARRVAIDRLAALIVKQADSLA